jgi:hypothetical protein
MAAAKGEDFLPLPPEDEEEPEVTREAVKRDRKAAAVKAAPTMTRRSWYVDAAAADAFQSAVDDIHHATRTPKHLVVAALLQAAVDQGERVQKKLTPKGSHASHG